MILELLQQNNVQIHAFESNRDKKVKFGKPHRLNDGVKNIKPTLSCLQPYGPTVPPEYTWRIDLNRPMNDDRWQRGHEDDGAMGLLLCCVSWKRS